MAVSTRILWHHRVEDWFFERYMSHFGKMPFDTASAAGANWLVKLGPLIPTHQTVLKNLRLAYPNESEAWRADLARAQWSDLGRLVGELPHLQEVSFGGADGRAQTVHPERFDAVRASGKGAVFISGHFSCFELMAAAIMQSGVKCAVTYRPIKNPLIDKRIYDVRARYGIKLQSAKGREGGMGLLRTLKRGESVAFMNDQKYNEGVAAPFFGHDAMTADAPSRLALQFGVPLIPLSIRRVEQTRFRVEAHEPIAINAALPEKDAIRDAVVRVNQFIEAQVRAAPEQWFWVHKRWPAEAWAAAGA